MPHSQHSPNHPNDGDDQVEQVEAASAPDEPAAEQRHGTNSADDDPYAGYEPL